MARRTSTGASGRRFGTAGTALWKAITGAFVDLDPRELAVLEAACAQADDVALLEALLVKDGPVVRGSMGQPRLSQVLAELRQGRLAVGRLLDLLVLPGADDSDKPATGRSRRAKAAADYRWGLREKTEAERAGTAAGQYGPGARRG